MRIGDKVVCTSSSIIKLPLFKSRTSKEILEVHKDVILGVDTIVNSLNKWDKPRIPVLTIVDISGDYLSFYSSSKLKKEKRRLFYHPKYKFQLLEKYEEENGKL